MVVIENRSARYDYFIEDTLECGISLKGNEVKSIRAGKASINEAWCQIQDGNLVVRGMFISKWDTANSFDVEERRERQLLAHKREILKVKQCISEVGYTLVPLKVYFVGSKCKMLVGVCKGKHSYDKRAVIKKRTADMNIRKAMKDSSRGGYL